MTEMVKYSAVATSYNNEDEIIQFLENLMEQTILPEEIVISDGGSKDNTVKLIQGFSHNTSTKIVVRFGKRLNIAEGFNDAIKNANNNIIFIAGIGNKYPADFFESLYRFFVNESADVACPYILGQDNTDFAKSYNKVKANNNRGLDGIYAANHGCIAKKSIFPELGYFYEHFIYAGEDAEFFGMAREKGYRVLSTDTVHVMWDTPHNWKQYLRQVDVYSIGDLQRYSFSELIRVNRYSLVKMFITLFALIGLLFPILRLASLVVLLVVLLRVVRSLINHGATGTGIILASRYLKIFNYIKHHKYIEKKYKVCR